MWVGICVFIFVNLIVLNSLFLVCLALVLDYIAKIAIHRVTVSESWETILGLFPDP